MTRVFAWFHTHDTALWWMGAVSIVTFVGSLILIPLLVVRIRVDYFSREQREPDRSPPQHAALRFVGRILKNFVGIVFIVTGIVMLVLPGQGVLTILLGIMLMSFPGKRALERRIVQQPTVLQAINWMRAKANQPALEISEPGLTRVDNREIG